jgi:hypothetical protein
MIMGGLERRKRLKSVNIAKSSLAIVLPHHEKQKQELVVEEAFESPLNLFKLKSQQASSYDSLKFLKEERGDR